MNRRLEVVKHWLLTSRNDVGVRELLKNALDVKCDVKARPFITKVEKDGEFFIVYLKGFDRPLYYPRKMDFQSVNQVITESFYPDQWHFYEIPETKVGADDVVVDCGAAEGLFSLMVANRCKHVYAVEPLPAFVKALNLTLAHFNNVTVIPSGLSERPGKAYMDDNNISSAVSDTGNTEVSLETIDNLFVGRGIDIDYLKADLEGYEMNMLKGATETIRKCKPKIAITTYHVAEHAEQIKAFLEGVNPNYKFKVKGIEERAGAPVMLHAWE